MATKVNGLIQKVNPGNNTQYSIASTAYGYCETAAATAAKVVDMTGFTLLEGTTIHVKFKENNTAASPTLNVNGTGAKPIVQYGTTAAGTSSSTTGWYAGAVVSFTYDGTSWVRDQGFNTNTTYTLAGLMGSTAIGSSTKPVYWTGSAFAGISSYEGNAATATKLSNTPNNTTTFLRGDNTWTNTLKQSTSAALGIDTNLKIGTAKKDFHIEVSNGSGTEINSGNAGGITFGDSSSAYAGIYYQTSGNYGTKLHFATTNLYADGSKSRMMIAPSGNIGINTLSPSYKLEVNGTTGLKSTVTLGSGGAYTISADGSHYSGNAATATKFASAQSIALTGDVTGSASSQAGWSIATTLANSGVTANTYGNTSQQTPAHGGTFNIPYFKVDVKGRVTQAGTTTVKLPADSNTDTKVNVIKRGTSKSYILGDTTVPPDSATAHTAVAESHIYMTTTAGQISAKSYSFNDGAATPTEKAQVIYNTANGCLEIVVA